MDPETRLIELETRFAYLEETQQVLSTVVARQQRAIDQLQQTCRQLAERLARASTDATFKSTPADDLPPHY
jgi:SlyX protein